MKRTNQFTQAAFAKVLGCSRAYIGELIRNDKIKDLKVNNKKCRVVEINGGKYIELY